MKRDSLLEVCAVLLFTNGLVWKALRFAVESTAVVAGLSGFMTSLPETLSDISKTQSIANVLRSSINPTAGLMVKDLWSAYTARRAWAIRGANLTCRNGEITLLLGDDGAGKTRFLTAIAESILMPPKRGLTSTLVRGSICLGGLDVQKWDRNMLKKRLGLFLNDVSVLADFARISSGLTLEEILEPADNSKGRSSSYSSGAYEKSCMKLAVKVIYFVGVTRESITR